MTSCPIISIVSELRHAHCCVSSCQSNSRSSASTTRVGVKNLLCRCFHFSYYCTYFSTRWSRPIFTGRKTIVHWRGVTMYLTSYIGYDPVADPGFQKGGGAFFLLFYGKEGGGVNFAKKATTNKPYQCFEPCKNLSKHTLRNTGEKRGGGSGGRPPEIFKENWFKIVQFLTLLIGTLHNSCTHATGGYITVHLWFMYNLIAGIKWLIFEKPCDIMNALILDDFVKELIEIYGNKCFIIPNDWSEFEKKKKKLLRAKQAENFGITCTFLIKFSKC